MNKGQKGGAKRKAIEVRPKIKAPENIKFFSGLFNRAFPTKGLISSEETLKIPIRIPISVSLDSNLER